MIDNMNPACVPMYSPEAWARLEAIAAGDGELTDEEKYAAPYPSPADVGFYDREQIRAAVAKGRLHCHHQRYVWEGGDRL